MKRTGGGLRFISISKAWTKSIQAVKSLLLLLSKEVMVKLTPISRRSGQMF